MYYVYNYIDKLMNLILSVRRRLENNSNVGRLFD